MDKEVGTSNGLEETPMLTLSPDQRCKLAINENMLDAIREVFCEMDEDGNGTLSTSELDDAMTALGVSYTRDDLSDLMHEFDTNGDGMVDFLEFAQMIASKMKFQDTEKDLRATFDVFDKNGDGVISSEELRFMLESIGEHLPDSEINKMMTEADENHDGEIDFNEFCKIWTDQTNDTCEDSKSKASTDSSTDEKQNVCQN